MISEILMDVETTGLLKASERPLEDQPYIIEIYALKRIDKQGRQGRQKSIYHSMVKPPIPIPEECVKITGITDEMVKAAPSFAEIYFTLCQFYLGVNILVGHNVSFDAGVLECELKRIDRVTRFPWPPSQICTVEESFSIRGRRLKLSELYLMATGEEFKDAHRGKEDVEALEKCYDWLQEEQSDD